MIHHIVCTDGLITYVMTNIAKIGQAAVLCCCWWFVELSDMKPITESSNSRNSYSPIERRHFPVDLSSPN